MDVLDCKSASRCRTCHHFTSTGCALEKDLAAYEAPARSAIPVTLAWHEPVADAIPA